MIVLVFNRDMLENLTICACHMNRNIKSDLNQKIVDLIIMIT